MNACVRMDITVARVRRLALGDYCALGQGVVTFSAEVYRRA